MRSIDELYELAWNGTLFTPLEIKYIMQKAIEILSNEKNVIYISSSITVVGDIHGQFNDLKELFDTGGKVPDTNYLFLGDYVDRGFQSLEVMILLTLMKIKYPNRVYLLRGNHESRQTNQNYGFHVECLKKYNQSSTVWLYINEMFDYLPLAAVIDNKLFCIHGGLSPSIQKIEDIKVLERCKDIPTEGPMADLVWSDPDENTEGFKISERGAGFLFGETVIDKFLHLNKMETIVRAHQLCKEGYLILFGGKIITVWSAPNYCGRIYNYASIMEVDEELNKFFNIFEDNERLVSNQEYRAKVLECFNPEMDKYFD
jgi:serine/threonine-protein phosphatase PPG1